MDQPTRKLIKEVWKRLRPYRGGLIVSMLFLLLALPLGQMHPLFWKYVVDHVLPEKDVTALLVVLGLMLGVQLLSAVAGSAQEFFLEKAGQRLVRDLRVEAYAKLGGQSMRYHHDRRTGDLVTRVISDVDAMETSVLRNLSSALEELATFLIVGGIVIALQPTIGLLVILPLSLAFFIIKKFNREVRGVYGKLREQLGTIGTFVHDRLGGVQLIQGFGREKEEVALFASVVSGHYQSAIRALRMRCLFFPLVGVGGFLSNVLMLGLGVWFIWKGEFTIGGLIAYRAYWWRLQSPINTLARMSDTLQRARASAERVMGLLNEPVEIQDRPGAVELTNPRGALRFDRVSFSYEPEKPVLCDVSFSMQPGDFLAIAGSSGAGKTSLLGLIPRFFDPTGGRVEVDGKDVREWTLHSLRRSLGLVQQETYLFNETIINNIRYARPDASVEEVKLAAQQANAHEFITELLQGYETRVGERGVKLSGGQKQRLSLARAFLANPAILLLDEPTSAVEPESEELIANAIEALARERTTLLVTHRVSLLRRAPRILFFSGQVLVADGTHDSLLLDCPAYRKSYSLWEAEETDRL